MRPGLEYTYFFQLHTIILSFLVLTMIFLKFISSFNAHNLAFSSDDTRHFVSARAWNYGVSLYTSLNIDFVVMFAGHSETECLRFGCPFIENPSELY